MLGSHPDTILQTKQVFITARARVEPLHKVLSKY